VRGEPVDEIGGIHLHGSWQSGMGDVEWYNSGCRPAGSDRLRPGYGGPPELLRRGKTRPYKRLVTLE
jgi:hypothetical protein